MRLACRVVDNKAGDFPSFFRAKQFQGQSVFAAWLHDVATGLVTDFPGAKAGAIGPGIGGSGA